MITPMPLPFPRDAIVPQMSLETFEYHYDRHFMAYVNKTNDLAAELPGTLEDIIRNAYQHNTALFQAAGQAWNHAFFWMSLSPQQGSAPSGRLAQAIARDFGDFGTFCDKFAKAGAGQFGSGWCWLVADASGMLSLATTHDAMPVWIDKDLTALLVCDVWEHAYYIDWRNDRGGFLTAFITERANWDFAAQQYDAAVSGSGQWSYPQ
ncbi:MAG: superoxide dismutase [Rhodospirillales bacterium]|nr:superoxide dismutase [Rhodospirillales bacterium]